jgi:hypothetical protein
MNGVGDEVNHVHRHSALLLNTKKVVRFGAYPSESATRKRDNHPARQAVQQCTDEDYPGRTTG